MKVNITLVLVVIENRDSGLCRFSKTSIRLTCGSATKQMRSDDSASLNEEEDSESSSRFGRRFRGTAAGSLTDPCTYVREERTKKNVGEMQLW